jgi:hypothetical protein
MTKTLQGLNIREFAMFKSETRAIEFNLPRDQTYGGPTGLSLGKSTQFSISTETSNLQSRYLKFYKCKQLAQFYLSIGVLAIWAAQTCTEKIYRYNFGDVSCFVIIAVNLTLGLLLFWTLLPVTMNDPSPNSEDSTNIEKFAESVGRIFDVIKVKECSVLSHTGDHYWVQLRLLVKDTFVDRKTFFEQVFGGFLGWGIGERDGDL